MQRRYYDEPVPTERRAAHADELRPGVAPDATPPAVPELGEPEQQRGGSLTYHRPPIGALLRTDQQDPDLGAEVKQSGAGRAFITPGLTFPEQSPTPEPDHRRIARPMPTMARDQVEVIRPPRGVADA